MTQAQLSLSWDAHQKNICNGLSGFQQRGEFVDMTLAADGHHVKVHQMVMALVSPYIKELISTAQCPHPVIFLNNISYNTLCAILEYIYMGEVLVATDKLPDLLAAGKALHIKGLREMGLSEGSPLKTVPSQSADDQGIALNPITTSNTSLSKNKGLSEKLREYREKKKEKQPNEEKESPVLPMCKVFVDDDDIHEDVSMEMQIESTEVKNSETENKLDTIPKRPKHVKRSEMTAEETRKTLMNPKLQYTVSNQGGLQVIYNRYIYHLRYFGKKNRVRLWRCIDYSNNLKCPANINTDENNQVTTRSFTHNHPFHDSKILKKLRYGIIYSAFQDAESIAEGKKKERRVPCSPTPDQSTDE